MQTVLRTFEQTDGDITVEREFRFSEPIQGAAGRPLLIFAHGHGGGALNFSQDPAFTPWIDRGYNFLFLQGLPQGAERKAGWRTLASTYSEYKNLDEDYTLEVIRRVQAEWGTDPDQICMGGFSQGTDLNWQMYVHQAALIRGFCTAGRGIASAFVGLVPSVRRPWATTIGRQDKAWRGHNGTEDALGAQETFNYVLKLNNAVKTPTETMYGKPPEPTVGTKLTGYGYGAPSGSSFAPCGAGEVNAVTEPAGHRWFDFSKGDNFSMTTACIAFWRKYAGLAAPLSAP